MVLGIDYIGKYKLVETRTTKKGTCSESNVMHTDNCREVVWYANQDPQRLKPVNVCGNHDFYMKDDRWYSYEI